MLYVIRKDSHTRTENYFATRETMLHQYFVYIYGSGLFILKQSRAADKVEWQKDRKEQLK